jgi:AraC-like DNA-binding protein
VDISSNDYYMAKIGQRYLQRLSEALAQRFSEISPPLVPLPCTLADIYPAIRELLRQHELPGLGMEFGYRLSVSDYGIVGLAIASTSRLAEALDTQLRFLKIITNANKVGYELSSTNALMVLTVTESTPNEAGHQFVLESELAAQVRFISDLLPTVKMSRVTLHLPYRCPTTRKHYQTLLGCRVLFRQSEAKLTFPLAWMDLPLQTTDRLLAPLLADRCDAIMARMDVTDDWVLRIRSYLLNSGAYMQSLSTTAEALNVPVHTVRWHLYKSGTSYKQIILDVRMQLARQYLEDTPLTLQQISYQLGYAQPSNFQLAFKKYFNKPPGQWSPAPGSI